jgi:hypothetical protein
MTDAQLKKLAELNNFELTYELFHFARLALITAKIIAVRKEREACVKICEDYVKDMDREYKEIGEEIAGTIQARGNVHANEWVGLTDVEIVGATCECVDDGTFNMFCAYDFAKTIEVILKGKNT